MSKGVSYWLRWVALLPGAIIAGMLALLPLHWVLYSFFSSFVEPYPEFPERILTPFAIAGIFVWSGSRIAPEFKFETAIILFGIWLFVVGGFFFLTFSGSEWMGRSLRFQAGGLGLIMGIVGALLALYIVRKEQLEASAT